MKTFYHFFEDEKLLVQKASGNWSIDDYKKHVDTVFRNPKILNVNKILTDLRNANFENILDDLSAIIVLRKRMIKLKFNSVVLVDNPSATAITQLYQKRIDPKGNTHAFCSTMGKALSILKTNLKEKEIETILLLDN